MRRRIDLYIAGTLADLSDQSFVLFNYAFADIQDPTVVKNEWSQQVTLPGTPTNNRIFDHYYRPDRITGPGFNALKKTSFAIYADTGEILQRGYCRLDEVSRAGSIVTGYKVTLFGGLGSFFYGLTYRDDGEKMTLADLDYLGTANPATELDFNILATNVTAAWARLQNSPIETTNIWDVINFAPCYEGIPEGDFDADKVFGTGFGIGLTAPAGYTFKNYATIVKLPEKVDMWAVKDLRSYLQRPVVSMRGILAGIARKASENGYTFDYSDIPATEYETLWKTLPDIPSLGSFRKQTGTLVATLSATSGVTDVEVATWNLSGLGSYVGVIIDASLAFRLTWHDSNYPSAKFNYGNTRATFIFVQLVAYAGNTKLKGSEVLCIGPDIVTPNPSELASWFSYTPEANPPAYTYFGTQPVRPETGTYQVPGDMIFNLSDTGVTKYKLFVTTYACQGTFNGTHWFVSQWSGGYSSVPVLYRDGSGTQLTPNAGTEITNGWNTSNVLNYSTPQAPRSGAALGKDTLLQSRHTPADYLLGWAKLCGYVFRYDTAAKTVYLERRNTFYGTGLDPIDLSDRVDRSRGVTIAPLNLQAKWYDFGTEVAQGAFAQEYADNYGRPYGWQRVNTGYDFDSAVVRLFEGSPYRAAVCKTAHGPYWCNPGSFVSQPLPAFRWSGCKYVAWDSNDGREVEFEIPTLPSSTSVGWYNPTYHYYDLPDVTRLELCTQDKKRVDGEDILCEFQGVKTMNRFHVSDDTAAMLKANKGSGTDNGRPCWLFAVALSSPKIPTFSRYAITSGEVTRSLDFGTPQEVDIPEISFADGSDLYDRAWAAYMADRLSLDTKVLRCAVDLRGLQVGQELLRRFFWYEDALWVLGKIDNYSLTTWDLAQCEFIQVRDTDNYTIGQL